MSEVIARLQELLIAHESQMLDEAQREELKHILKSDAQARRQFIRWQMTEAALRLEFDVGMADVERDSLERNVTQNAEVAAEVTPPVPQSIDSTNRKLDWRSLLAMASIVLAVLLASRLAYLESMGGASSDSIAQGKSLSDDVPPAANPTGGSERLAVTQERTSGGLALITQMVDVVWTDEAPAYQVGEALPAGPLSIESGYMQIEFFCGASVVVEGPAELELESFKVARCFNGKLRAQVPPAARGFEILVEDVRVVDLGTEFGLSVDEQGADVHVFDGEVEVHHGDTTQLVTAGQAISRDGEQSWAARESTPDRFFDLGQLDSRAKNQIAARYQRWKRHADDMRQDPRLILYYAMDGSSGWQRKLPNDALNPVGSQDAAGTEVDELDGAIVGARRVDGRWPQKSALEFKHPGDRVRVDIPGEFSSLTLTCWVKIDSLDRWYNSLFLTDNYQRGEPHWQILDTGQLFFSVRVAEGENGPEHREVVSPVFWKPSMSGQWLHLATTYDVGRQVTTHFLNGQMLIEERIPDYQLVPTTRIGLASIGNWSTPTKPAERFAIRNLNGSIDEFAMFADALSAVEIKKIYDAGKP